MPGRRKKCDSNEPRIRIPWPSWPARAVRPSRWTSGGQLNFDLLEGDRIRGDSHCSSLLGSPTWMTAVTPLTSIPRAVTSELKSTPDLAFRNASVALSRADCDIRE